MEHQARDIRRDGDEEQANQTGNVYYQQGFDSFHGYDYDKIKPQKKNYQMVSRLFLLTLSFFTGYLIIRLIGNQHSSFEFSFGEIYLLGWFIAFNLFENTMLSLRPLRTTIHRLETRLQIAFFSAFLLTLCVYCIFINSIHNTAFLFVGTAGSLIFVAGFLLLNIYIYLLKHGSASQQSNDEPYQPQQIHL